MQIFRVDIFAGCKIDKNFNFMISFVIENITFNLGMLIFHTIDFMIWVVAFSGSIKTVGIYVV